MSTLSVGTVVYVVARTIIAVVLLVLVARGRAPRGLGAQALSDAAAGLLVLAYAGYGLRAALGWLSVLLFIYFVAWEVIAAARRLDAMGEEVGDQWSDTELIGGTMRWVWDVAGIAPVFIAGVLVAGSVVLPGQYSLPGSPPPLSCAPAEVAPGETVILRMRTPHGGDLGVFTPRRGYYVLKSTPAAGTVPYAQRFEHQERLAIPTALTTARRLRGGGAEELVFADTGKYQFSLSEYKDPSLSLMCAVHYGP